MEPILTIGIILLTGFVAGGLCRQIGLPKVTGYILAGLVLNPELTHFIPSSFVDHTNLVTQIALAFITFSVGGTLQRSKIQSMGKAILYITVFEAEFAFLSVAVFFILLAPVVLAGPDRGLLTYFIPMGLMLASLAAPTDPSATLAVAHEFHAKGDVTATIMGVAAFDDILGIINYSLAVSVAGIFASQLHFSPYSIAGPFLKIAGSIAGGCVFAGGLNVLSKWIGNETEGVLISLIISLLALCYGIIDKVGADALLATMTMGIIVVNHNPQSEKIFSILERYTEELIFILFFTISTMHLNFSVLASNYLLIFMFVFFRLIGKIGGTAVGGKLSHASDRVQKYTAGGLIPQGGIVIGLALVIKQNPAFNTVSDVILNVIIGATIIHEIIGPMLSKWALSRAGEIKAGSRG